MAVKKEPESTLMPGEIMVAPGTSKERIVKIVSPTGKANRRKMARHFPKMAVLQKLAGDGGEPSLVQVGAVINELWGEDDTSFEDELMPMLLGINGNKEMADWYETLALMDVFRAFTEAVAVVLTPEESEVLRDVQKK